MRVRILAVGRRLPAWVETGIGSYLERFPRPLRPEVVPVEAGARGRGDPRQAEGVRLLAALRSGERPVALAIDGQAVDTEALARRLAAWRRGREDVALLIGGADGLDAPVLERAQDRLSLSPLTLPHALARLLLVEQLYRAQSLLENHPYHRA